MPPDIAIFILTRNEERNLPHALSSVIGWAKEVFVIDSFSSDKTQQIALSHGATFVQHEFVDYGSQRNFAISMLPTTCEWAFFLDADERMTEELKSEIETLLLRDPTENGFLLRFRLIWMGKWIRRGYYPTWILRLFRIKSARCEERAVNEHLVIRGAVGKLKNDLIHEDHNGLDRWIEKHVRYASREAVELVRERTVAGQLKESLWGGQAARKRWVRAHVWIRLPPLLRPALYFGYRYILRGGLLDGREALAYHFLQAFWFQFLVDIKYLEMRSNEPRDCSRKQPSH